MIRAAAKNHDDVAVVVEAADVPRAIVEFAHAQKADYIAMATHGRSGIRRLLLGSVAEQRGDRRTAISFYRQATTLLPDEAEVHAVLAVALAAVNIFGGFLVTRRMLEMFKKKDKPAKAVEVKK